MLHRKGGSPLSQTFTAILVATLCIGHVSGFDGDAILPLLKLYVKKMRTFMDSYHPEIGFATCAISTFPLYDLLPDALREFHPENHEESLQSISSRSYNDSDTSNVIPSHYKTEGDISYSTEAPMPSYQPSSLHKSTQYPFSSTSSPVVSNQSSTSVFVSTPSTPSWVLTTPLPILAAYLPLPPINQQNDSLSSNLPTTIFAISNTNPSLPVLPESSNSPTPINSTPTSPLPSYFLFQAMKASGFSSEDSIFIIELLELLFPDVFTSSIADMITAWQGGDNPKLRQNDSLSIADAWLEGLDAVLASIFGAHPHMKREPLRNLLPTLRWETVVPSEKQVPLSRFGEENEEENVMSEWWTSVRSTSARLFHRLRMWVLPDADRTSLGKAEAKVIGLAHCARGYLVDFIWRWAEDEAEELRREVEEKKRENHIFRPKTSQVQVVPPLIKALMPS